jgi:hypothetical protein
MKTREEKLQAKRDYYYKNRDKVLAKQKETKKAYYQNNKEKVTEYIKQWNEENKEKLADTKSKWASKNRDKLNKSQAKWRANHKDKFNALKAKRRAEVLNATPLWITKNDYKDIESFYVCSKMFSMYTGDKYHVDHIIPLRGKRVNGLHVPNNLQVIPAKENLRKNNSFTDFNII